MARRICNFLAQISDVPSPYSVVPTHRPNVARRVAVDTSNVVPEARLGPRGHFMALASRPMALAPVSKVQALDVALRVELHHAQTQGPTLLN